ncbi:hypothetical protein ACE6ED_23380, partial [Paenibacillus sp. CN-4]|uniref:hypothetical protein n=1 Tax=Paenibacillus nanchangensis TaxID=3348343 RepID=UPI00397BD0F1
QIRRSASPAPPVRLSFSLYALPLNFENNSVSRCGASSSERCFFMILRIDFRIISRNDITYKRNLFDPFPGI